MDDEKLKKIIARLPLTTGVYIFLDSKGKALYVGKAVSIRDRIRGHFTGIKDRRKESFLRLVDGIDVIDCKSEEQALILEAALIKERQPKYNVLLKDNKSYPYIEISNDLYPRVFVSRPKNKKGKILFGPYSQGKLLRESLKVIRKVFPFRSCKHMPKKECLYFHIGLCPAPCVNKINSQAYKKQIKHIARILDGARKTLIAELKKEMFLASKKLDFETAVELRDSLIAVECLYQGRHSQHSLLELKERLNLKSLPVNIEAIDISLISGKYAVGSLVVFKYGTPYRAGYRKFRIKTVTGMDDYAMISEIVRRRYGGMIKRKQMLPDLIVIDGGKGQVNSAYEQLALLGLDICVIGLAKKNEEIWFPHNNRPLILEKQSQALQLVQRIRDESHRFAQNYHKLLRSKGMLNNMK